MASSREELPLRGLEQPEMAGKFPQESLQVPSVVPDSGAAASLLPRPYAASPFLFPVGLALVSANFFVSNMKMSSPTLRAKELC